jgi:Ni,Fe-hydrogenase III large subunit/Ni,Fe-hydrogenase III component G
MNSALSIPSAFAACPGVLTPPSLAHGVWRVRVDSAGLPRVMTVALQDVGCTLLLVAGEDRRPASAGMHAHYLCGHPESHELIHVEVALEPGAPSVPSLAALSFPASRFEREMRDLLGITPVDHPDARPLVRHGSWPASFHPLEYAAVTPSTGQEDAPFPFTSVEGEGVYQIPVGPVHAGVIEPGHFRFNVLGETILKMRARLYFTHKGTERLFAGRAPADGVSLAERISGDTSVGHGVAYAQAIESLAGVDLPAAAAATRVILLELERLYNHVGDVGAILADTGYAIGQAHALRVREALLRVNKRLTGHRLLRGMVVPGGLARALTDTDVLGDVRRAVADFNDIVSISLANTLVTDRLDETGRLAAEVARDFGVVGYVARACGIARDIRADHPGPGYAGVAVTPAVEQTGDVRARMMVRVREVADAVGHVERALRRSASGPLCVPIDRLPPYVMGFGLVEAWRGRLAHAVMADETGRLHRVKVVDPSFFNWPALARALEDNIVPDFPLCNKSFNLSYSGNDL